MHLSLDKSIIFATFQKYLSNKEFDPYLSISMKDEILYMKNRFLLKSDINNALTRIYKPDKIKTFEMPPNSDWFIPKSDLAIPSREYDAAIRKLLILNDHYGPITNTRYICLIINDKYYVFAYNKHLPEEENSTNFIHFMAKQKKDSMYKRILHAYMAWFDAFDTLIYKIMQLLLYDKEFLNGLPDIIFRKILNDLYNDHSDKRRIEDDIFSVLLNFNHKMTHNNHFTYIELERFIDRFITQCDEIKAKLFRCRGTNPVWNNPKDVRSKLNEAIISAIDKYSSENRNEIIKQMIYYDFKHFWNSCSVRSILTELNINRNRKLYLNRQFFKVGNKLSLINALLLIMSHELEPLRPFRHDEPRLALSEQLKRPHDFGNLSINMKYHIDCEQGEITVSVINIGFADDINETDIKKAVNDHMRLDHMRLVYRKTFFKFNNQILFKVISVQARKLIDRNDYLVNLIEKHGYNLVLPTIIVDEERQYI